MFLVFANLWFCIRCVFVDERWKGSKNKEERKMERNENTLSL